MNANKVLTVRFESWKDFKEKVTTSLREKKASITPKASLVFNSVTDYQKFMTEQKLAILATIMAKKPTSIYQLAQLVDRDFANVQRDCVALDGMGFIKLVNTKNTKGSKTPKLSFDYRKIVVQMPQLSYSHVFDEAA